MPTTTNLGLVLPTVGGSEDTWGDDYEQAFEDIDALFPKGTFTPTLKIGGLTTGITYTTQEGHYSRVNDRIHYEINIVLLNKGALTGQVTIDTDLPGSAQEDSAAACFANNLVFAGGLQVVLVAGNTEFFLYALNTGTMGALDNTNITNTTRLTLTGSYRVA